MNAVQANNVADIVALTPNQEGILFHYLEDSTQQHYRIQLVLRLAGEIDSTLFQQAWQTVVQSNEMLRTVFRWLDVKQPVQIILKEYTPRIEIYDVAHSVERERLVEARILHDQQMPVDLQQECYRVILCNVATNEYVLVMSVHHIIYDGWSNGILWKELFTAYSELAQGRTPRLIQKPAFKTYVKHLRQQNNLDQETFWRSYLADIDTAPLLKQIRPDDASRPRRYTSLRRQLSPEIQQTLTAFLRTNDLSLATCIYAAWGMLLSAYCNSTQVVFGRVSSGRNAEIPGIENLIGLCINVHPLRLGLLADHTLGDCIQRIKDDIYHLAAYETTPLYAIKKYLGLKHAVDLFNTIVVIENYPLAPEFFDRRRALSIVDYAIAESNHYDLTLSVEAFEDIKLNVIFDQAQFEDWFIERLVDHLLQIIVAMVHNGLGQKLADIRMLAESEQQQILEGFNATKTAFPADKTVIDLFEAQVAQSPERTAIITNGATVTYEAFNARVNQLAHDLHTLGVTPDSIVGVVTYRSLEMMIAIFAIVKAGAAYLPIDPQYPESRIAYLVQDADVALIVSHQPYAQKLAGVARVIDLDSCDLSAYPTTNLRGMHQPDQAAYVIYTSGTTGNPKGVVIEHRSLVNRLAWMQANSPIGPADVVLQKTTYTFDVSVWEIFWWSIQGATLCLLEPGGEKNPQTLLKTMLNNAVTTLHFVPSMLNAFLIYLETQRFANRLPEVKYVISSGEALTPDLVERFYALFDYPQARLINLYGPTEATIDVSYYNCDPTTGSLAEVPIGRPIANTLLLVVGPHGQLQPVGVPGELCIGGVQLARGYLNQPVLTAEKFVISATLPGVRLYKTGDRAYWLPDGNMVFLGRMDRQVKLRGFRIELGEIESVLRTIGGVKDAVALITRPLGNEPRLHAYLRMDDPLDLAETRRLVAAKLPGYMVPSAFIPLRAFPTTPNGKLDRAALALISSEPERPAPQAMPDPANETEQLILSIWRDVLGSEQIGIHDNYFDVGGNSINLIRVYGKLHPHYPDKLTVTRLFHYPTVAALAAYLLSSADAGDERAPVLDTAQPQAEDTQAQAIAVIGLAGRFPGAETIKEFWQNLVAGVEAIRFFTQAELHEAGVVEDVLHDPRYVSAAGQLKGLKDFDASFFGYSPKEAELLDPQIRIFLECTWETLEDAGYAGQARSETIGLFAGASPNLLWELGALRSGSGEALGTFAAEKLINKDHLAAQVAYRLDLAGPVFSLYTACSTSLVAVHLACQALFNNECSIALAGGVSAVAHYNEYGYLYEEGMVFSPDGHCRAFDKDAQGFVGGMGAGVVALKRLDQAIRDGDNIYSVIKGSAINNDGDRKLGYTALSVEVQAEAVRSAISKAGVAPETISYIETHGSGTPLGDTLEMQALELAFASQKKHFCAVGSVKTNIGHLDCSAGVAGLIKTILALKHKTLPPSLNFEVPNPKINFIDSPFFVSAEVAPWDSQDHPRRAGVNSLGLGGTNAHVILEEYIPQAVERPPVDSQVLVLSAKSEAALAKQCARLKDFLDQHPATNLGDLAYTLQVGREHFAYRRALVCATVDQARADLLPMSHGCAYAPKPPRLVYVLQHSEQSDPLAMLAHYRQQPGLKEAIDHGCALLGELLRLDLSDEFFAGPTWKTQARDLRLAQPCSFIAQYARARWLSQLGVAPSAYVADRLGEIVAGCLAGALSLNDALLLTLRQDRAVDNQTLNAAFNKLPARAPAIPFFSQQHQGWATPGVALDRSYWLSAAPLHTRELPDVIAELFPDPVADNVLLIGLEPGELYSPLLLHEQGTGQLPRAEALLVLLARLWERGVAINWAGYHVGAQRLRISLPTYPFDHQAYWIPQYPLQQLPTNDTQRQHAVKQADIADWFYYPCWELAPLQDSPLDDSGASLVFADKSQLNLRLLETLRQRQDTTIVVWPGSDFREIDGHTYEIEPENPQSYARLLRELEQKHGLPAQILHAWSVGDEPSTGGSALTYGYFSLIYLAQALSRRGTTHAIQLNVLTSGSYSVTGGEELQADYAMLSAACLVTAQEIPLLRCRHIDIVMPEAGSWQEAQLAQQIVSEISMPIADVHVAYRNNRRWTRMYKHVSIPATTSERLQEKGVYLLIGGLGGIGLELSQFLAETCRARLVLVGRSEFPPRSEWEPWLQRHDAAEPVSQKIRRLLQIEQLGAELCILAADATNHAQMMMVMQRIEAQYGRLDGVIYAAVEKGDSLFKAISDLDVDDSWQQFKAKRDGLIVLEQVLGDRRLDFCMMMSSTSSVLGGLGFVAYAAANAFMDAFTFKHNQRSPSQWTVVNWETWNVGTNQNTFGYQAEIQAFAMSPAEGIEAFRRIVARPGFDQLVVSSGQLAQRIDQWVKLQIQADDAPKAQDAPRPSLSSSYRAPRSELEEIIVQVWRDFFGIVEIGVDDNLFELGATSLSIIQLSQNLRQKLNQHIPIVTFFTYPTISTLAAHLASATDEAPAPVDRSEEIDKGRNSARLRLGLRRR